MKKQEKIDKTWKNCLAMWKWIVGRVRYSDIMDVWDLKDQWCRENDFINLCDNCFFCEASLGSGCKKCPGTLVDSAFHCSNSEYDYGKHPILFYKELLRLNRKRKRK